MTELSERDAVRRFELARERFGLAGAPAPVPLAGDVGARRYFRQKVGHSSALLVLYPQPASAAQANWASVGAALASAGLRVPALHVDAPDLGAALIEDLGDRDLAIDLAEAPLEDRSRLLDEAEDLLLSVRSVSRAAAARNPPFDAEFFAAELEHTRHWALERGGREPLDAPRAADWQELARDLARAAADPRATGDPVPTHRDYHANNLMRAPDGRLAAIDFQDLRLGPPDYDPVSLRFERAAEAVECDASAYSEPVLLQRAWKVLGTFEKMMLKGRPFYRPHREAARRVIRRHTAPGGPFAPLLAFL
ncbi:MAG TPA: phosphotransferase [Thermoanaerobaculia bacterium]|nr:phosphotransferase [Thermoanaerobaculia bacterium]